MKNKIAIKSIVYCAVVFVICQILNIVFPSQAIVYQRNKIKELEKQKPEMEGDGVIIKYRDVGFFEKKIIRKL